MENIKSIPKILVVDDEPKNVKLIEANLIPQGYDVLTSFNGEDALRIISENSIDLVILDVMMPGIDGFEVTKRVRKNSKTHLIPVVLITAFKETEDRIKGIEAGCDDFLSKPFNRQELTARIKSLLRIKSLNDEVQEKKVEIEQRNRLLHKVMNHYVAEEIISDVMKNPDKSLRLGGRKCTATMMFADIRGFTSFSEGNTPEKIVKMLNTVYSVMLKVIYGRNGVFDKFLGDAIMTYFNVKADNPDSTLDALYTAVEMRSEFINLKKHGINLGLGIGINTGNVIVGNIGSEKTMDYTVIGDAVNTAKRIESKANAGQILISENTYKLIKDQVKVRKMPELHLKGKKEQIAVFELLEIV